MIEKMIPILEALIEHAKKCEMDIEGEWGIGRGREQMEAENLFSSEITDAEELVKELKE